MFLSYIRSIANWFIAGAAITAVFSGSLAKVASNAGWVEVLAVGMIVPSFTWAVQLTAAALLLRNPQRWLYGIDLSRVCVVGSIALLPAAVYNLSVPDPLGWLSAINVLVSVWLMAIVLFWRTERHGISSRWPISWCLTITFNMLLFLWSSRNWW